MTRVRKVLVAVAAVIVVVIAAGAVALSTIDLNQYVAFVEAKAKEATGRELKLKGKIGFKLSLLPTVAADDVSFQNAPWGSRPLLATVKRVEVQIALLPLLTGEVVIRRLRLVEPDLLLEVSPKGERNWVFTRPTSGGEKVAAAGDDAGFEVHRIEVRNGLLTYRQAKPRLAHKARIEQLELEGPKPGEVLVRVGACGLNNTDINTRTAWYSKSVTEGIGAGGRAGFDAAERVIRHVYAELTADLPNFEDLKDAKTRLQELVQADGNPLPVYDLERVSGKAHRQTFEVSCSLGDAGVRTHGRGLTRRDAEQQAAARMLDKLNRDSS